MQDLDSFPKRLLHAMVPKAEEKDLAQLVKKLGHHYEEDVSSLVDVLLTRGEASGKALLTLVPKMRPEAELYLAERPGVPQEVLQRLSKSKRKRTLTALVSRTSLPEEIVLALSKHKVDDVARSARRHPNFPVNERIRLLEEDPSSHRDQWLQSPEYLEKYMESRLTALRGRDPNERRGDWSLQSVPSGVLTERCTELLIEYLKELLHREDPGPVLSYLRRLPRGETLAAILHMVRAQGYDAKYPSLLQDSSYYFSKELFERRVGTRTARAFPTKWFDDASVDAAWDLGGPTRLLAAASPALCSERRASTVYNGTPEEQARVAHNSMLTPEEASHLVTALPEGQKWRLIGASLSLEDRIRVYSDGPMLVTNLFNLQSAQKSMGEKIAIDLEAWLSEELCRYVLTHRERALQDNTTSYGAFASRAVRRHPGLNELVLQHLKPTDRISAKVADVAAEAAIQILSAPGGRDTFCGLLPEWNGCVADLLTTASILSGEQLPAASAARQ